VNLDDVLSLGTSSVLAGGRPGVAAGGGARGWEIPPHPTCRVRCVSLPMG